MGTIKVVCGIIYKDDQVFICRRKMNKSLGGYWKFPGGKMETGETEQACLARELQEELDMKVTIGRHFKTVIHKYETFTIELIAFVCQFESAQYILTDHDQYKWVDQQDLCQWPLAPADISIATAIVADREAFKNGYTPT